MRDSEQFTLVTSFSHPKVIHDEWVAINGANGFDPDTALQAAFRRLYPKMALTVTIGSNGTYVFSCLLRSKELMYSLVNLLRFAAVGRATAILDTVDESVQRIRYFYAGSARRRIPDQLVESRTFGKYLYTWGTEYFIVYIVQMGDQQIQYILKEPAKGETIMSRNNVTDSLIAAVGNRQKPEDEEYIYVYDAGYWLPSRNLYEQVQKSKWNDVILNEDMKIIITELMNKFFDSKHIYKDLGVSWRRGVIFHGPADNGKTVSIKALMHSLFEKYEDTISRYTSCQHPKRLISGTSSRWLGAKCLVCSFLKTLIKLSRQTAAAIFSTRSKWVPYHLTISQACSQTCRLPYTS